MADLPDNPNNREEEYLADIAGLPNNVPENPWSRKEAYLAAISGRLDGIDAKIAALATDISLKGGVADYDHLPDDAAVGDAYITEDTGILYVWVGDEWTPLNMQGGSGIITLTADDYNYPTSGTATTIALWLLDPGMYRIQYTNGSCPSIKFFPGGGDQNFGDGELFIVFGNGSFNPSNREVMRIADQNTTDYYPQIYRLTGSSSKAYTLLTDNNVIDNLTSSSVSYYPLSAKQGYVLDKKIDGRVIQNAGAPTTSTVGTVGQLLEDTTNGKLYQCTAVSGNTYTWTEVGAGGGGPTVVQTIGNSETDVMSQKATSSMVYADSDPSNATLVRLGYSATVSSTAGIGIGVSATSGGTAAVCIGRHSKTSKEYTVAIGGGSNTANNTSAIANHAVAIGFKATANAIGAVAIGSGSSASSVGEFNIGSSSGEGYNYTNYRLLSGVHDGQDLHDAATVAQGNTLSDSAPTTSTVGVLGQLYTDTTNMHTYQCTAISGSTYTWIQRW